jgi:glycosyltransferase involved in cell wall biosynthesis
MPESSTSRWLLVSRPLIGPVLDGGPALLRELIPELPPEPVAYFGDVRRPLRRPSLGDELIRVPRLPGPLADGGANDLLERGAIGAALLTAERRRQPLHLFFDAGPLTERVAAGLAAAPGSLGSTSTSLAERASVGARNWLSLAGSLIRAQRPRSDARRPAPVVQTLTCTTGLETCARLLGALDAVVALSDDTRSRLLAAGVPSRIVHRIHPGVRPGTAITNPTELARRRAILYAGELDVGASDRLIELARTLSEPKMRGWTLIIACRPDDLVDHHQRIRLGRELAGAIGSGRVEMHGEVPDLRALQRRCAIQLWLADKVHRRLDLPLALLDGLACGLALITLDRAPVRELLTVAEQRGREIGIRVDPALGPPALVAAITSLTERPEQLLRLSEDASALVRDAFSSARMAADVAALHRELLGRFAHE